MALGQVQDAFRRYVERGSRGATRENAQILVRMRTFDVLSLGVTTAIGIAAPIYLGSPLIAIAGAGLLAFFVVCHLIAPFQRARYVKAVARIAVFTPVLIVVYAVAVLGAPITVGHSLLAIVVLAASHLIGVKDAIVFAGFGIVALAVMSGFGPREVAPPGALDVSSEVLFAGRCVLLLFMLGYAIASRNAEDRNAARLRAMARTDALTGIATRAELEERLEDALARSRRFGTQGAFVFLDLDRFKPVNDQLGHRAGDRVLQAVAQRLRGLVRAVDALGRLGGDEFGIVLSEISDIKGAGTVASRIRQQIELPIEIDGRYVEVGASIGLAPFPETGDAVDDVIRCADEAMYAAKRSGTHRCFGATPAGPLPIE